MAPHPVPQPDDTWRDVVARGDRVWRTQARVLPYRLGLTWKPDGGWGEYVTLDVLRDLPSYMADAVPGGVSSRVLSRYRRAHHCAGFYGLLVDRVADGQVVEDRALREDRARVWSAWLDALHLACGSRARAKAMIAEAMARWSRAVADEDAAMRRGHMEPEEYGALVRGKVSYLWVASEAMLRTEGVSDERRAELRDGFERLMLALQCNDDAMDEDEDRERWGKSVPEVLGVRAQWLSASARAIAIAMTMQAQGNLLATPQTLHCFQRTPTRAPEDALHAMLLHEKLMS